MMLKIIFAIFMGTYCLFLLLELTDEVLVTKCKRSENVLPFNCTYLSDFL